MFDLRLWAVIDRPYRSPSFFQIDWGLEDGINISAINPFGGNGDDATASASLIGTPDRFSFPDSFDHRATRCQERRMACLRRRRGQHALLRAGPDQPRQYQRLEDRL